MILTVFERERLYQVIDDNSRPTIIQRNVILSFNQARVENVVVDVTEDCRVEW